MLAGTLDLSEVEIVDSHMHPLQRKLISQAYAGQAAEFTPVAAYPGLTAEVRARLGEMKVAPVSAEMVGETVMPEAGREITTTATVTPKAVAPRTAKRAEAN